MQFGFCENHSLDNALVSLTESIGNSLDDQKSRCGISIDLQHEFDTVNHKILWDKLEHFGIHGTPLKQFAWYSSNRRQFVHINCSSSTFLDMTFGVP